MNCLEIVKKYLKDNGYDGLVNHDCGCGLDDFEPCDGLDSKECLPAYKHPNGGYTTTKAGVQNDV
ncbi:hypothetical protein [Sulfuricurvum sp.]|uniref:hypothetical protein n=1 Tax=Sulfuricurvum sp. TaxID=2025608 RepID=UPI0035698735